MKKLIIISILVAALVGGLVGGTVLAGKPIPTPTVTPNVVMESGGNYITVPYIDPNSPSSPWVTVMSLPPEWETPSYINSAVHVSLTVYVAGTIELLDEITLTTYFKGSSGTPIRHWTSLKDELAASTSVNLDDNSGHEITVEFDTVYSPGPQCMWALAVKNVGTNSTFYDLYVGANYTMTYPKS